MRRDEPLPGFDDLAPSDRYCDLILTGGVTSAIAYPAATFALASVYRFNAIGGSSSGAGAAALAAAAEYRRRHGSSDGFRTLLERTDAVADTFWGKTGLVWLFQPEPQNRRLFDALAPGFAQPGKKIGALARGLGQAYWLPSATVVAIIAALHVWLLTRTYEDSPTLLALWAAFSALVWLATSLLLAYRSLRNDVQSLVQADFGLCSGMDKDSAAPHPPLTEWLHGLIQEIAGRAKDGDPLTFADLEDAPGSPRETLGDMSAAGAKSISLQMFTANITHGRPYLFPQNETDRPLYFRPWEMRRLFPESVVARMMKRSCRHRGNEAVYVPAHVAAQTAADDDDALWRLPTRELPIVVAARMSVSFPLLFSAVPLWVLDDEGPDPVFRRCLFSDGGLCSNFPIHLFDSAVPPWPTFGIALHDLPNHGTEAPAATAGADSLRRPDGQEAVQLAEHHREGWRDHWNDFGERADASERLAGFASAMLSTIKDWNDAALARLPGVRDRVVHVWLRPNIGGLNILMTGSQIRSLARLGGEASKKLLRKFSKASAPNGVARGWNEHRWVRFNVLRGCLSETLAGLTWSVQQSRYSQPLRDQIRDAADAAPLEGASRASLLAAQAAALDGALDALMQVERALNAPACAQPYAPEPPPELRIRPRL